MNSGRVETHPIVVVGMLVDEGFKHFGGVVVGILCALAAEVLQAFCFAGGHGEKEGVIFLFAIEFKPLAAQFARGAVPATVAHHAVVAGGGCACG